MYAGVYVKVDSVYSNLEQPNNDCALAVPLLLVLLKLWRRVKRYAHVRWCPSRTIGPFRCCGSCTGSSFAC